MTDLRKKNGELTRQAFACGYLQSFTLDPNAPEDFYGTNAPAVTMYLDGVWHVKARIQTYDDRVWETFDSYADARKYWGKVRSALKSGEPVLNLFMPYTPRPVKAAK